MQEHGLVARRPAVTCTMVTRGRLARAKRSMDCFAVQSYPHRELVVVCDGVDEHQPLQAYAEHLRLDSVRVISVPRDSLSLGALRNLSFAQASGEYVCQWDDDDLNHPDRVATQIDGMIAAGGEASFLTDQLQLVERTGSLYWCDWSLFTRAGGGDRAPIPNTVICRRDVRCRYLEHGPRSRLGEDTSFARALQASHSTVLLEGLGHLYVYVTHGGNAWGDAHHRRIIRFAGLRRAQLCDRRTLIETALSAYPLAGRITVRDRYGVEVYSVHLPARPRDPSA
jgi:glycosyltransferase involved in cell wall biosynthesis